MIIRRLFVFALLMFLCTVSYAHNNKTLVLNLKGTGYMYFAMVPDIAGTPPGEDEAMCFDVDLINLKNGRNIGTATDCLYMPMEIGDGLQLVGTAYFNFKGGKTLVTRGITTVHPGQPESLAPFTHITGAAPSGFGDILPGTGRFSNASGDVRLSGIVDMSNFEPGVEGSPITFDCIFVITLD